MTAAIQTIELLFTWPGRFFAALLPVIIAACLVVLANLPISFTGGVLPAPALAFAAVYYWVLVRPDLMPPLAVLSIGLLEDLLSGGPPGFWAAGFLAAYALTNRQRDNFAGLSGAGALVAFAGAMLTASATAYLIASAVYVRLVPLPPLLLESVSTIAFYPLVARLCGGIQRKLVGPMREAE